LYIRNFQSASSFQLTHTLKKEIRDEAVAMCIAYNDIVCVCQSFTCHIHYGYGNLVGSYVYIVIHVAPTVHKASSFTRKCMSYCSFGAWHQEEIKHPHVHVHVGFAFCTRPLPSQSSSPPKTLDKRCTRSLSLLCNLLLLR
jgi:hypothetical protein